MKPAPFDYHRPDSVAAAAQLLTELGGDDAKLLGGGQSLVPMLSMRLAFFDHLIDISRLEEMKASKSRVAPCGSVVAPPMPRSARTSRSARACRC